MNKQKTGKAWSWKVATFLPMLALLLMAFGKSTTNQNLSIAKEKNNTINIHFEGKDYKTLELIIIMVDGSKKHFAGQSEKGKDWTFKYPDSIYNMHKYVRISVPSTVDTISGEINFRTVINNNGSRTYNFKQGISNIKAVYLKSSTRSHLPFTTEDGHGTVYKTMYSDEFFVETKSDQEFLSSIEKLLCGYSFFDGYNPSQLSYDGQLESYINLTKKYPDSYSLVYDLATKLTRYGSRSDVEKVYNCFSGSNKKSYWGKKIDHYIKNTHFSKGVLPVWNADRLEPIIKDPSKYNLIVFSASWCAPCHRMIPVLKEAYRDLAGKLEMVYVSMDEPSTVEKWKLLMKEEQIPWRSVLALYDVKGIKDKYTVQGIPLSLLVHPNGYSEIIDIRKKEDKEKLYKLVLDE